MKSWQRSVDVSEHSSTYVVKVFLFDEERMFFWKSDKILPGYTASQSKDCSHYSENTDFSKSHRVLKLAAYCARQRSGFSIWETKVRFWSILHSACCCCYEMIQSSASEWRQETHWKRSEQLRQASGSVCHLERLGSNPGQFMTGKRSTKDVSIDQYYSRNVPQPVVYYTCDWGLSR